MRIYLAGPWQARKTELPQVRAALRAIGYIVDCRWIDCDGADEKAEAKQDIADLAASDALLVYNPDGIKSEGKAFEQGFAYARNIPVVVVGPMNPATCVFHNLDDIKVVDSPVEAVEYLQSIGVMPAVLVKQPLFL